MTTARDSLHIALHLRNAAYLRHFQPLIELLVARGHRVTLLLQRELERERPTLERFLATPAISMTPAAARSGMTRRSALHVRGSLDYLRYLEPGFSHAAFLRGRQQVRAAPLVVWLARSGLLRATWARRTLADVLQGLDRGLPDAPEVTEQLRALAPDVVVVSPLLADADQADVVRAARRLDRPSVLLVASWDNLTNKGVVRDIPDKVLLWNEDQRREAVELHGIPDERITITGAHTFDPWFSRTPSQDRQAFCARFGFDPGAPIVLYLCSSVAIAREEPAWVGRWLAAVRAGDPRLASANVLIRPHPASGHGWRDSELADARGVAVWPPVGAMPTDETSRRDFYDSMHHAAAVVGINTSAIIESAILGRRGFSVLVPEFEGGQDGTLHFAYLRADCGGPLTVAHDLHEHVVQLAAGLDAETGPELRRFVERFVRPFGLDVPGAPLVTERLEAVTGEPLREHGDAGVGVRVGAWLLVLAVEAGHRVAAPFDGKSGRRRRWRAMRRRRRRRRAAGKVPAWRRRFRRIRRRSG